MVALSGSEPTPRQHSVDSDRADVRLSRRHEASPGTGPAWVDLANSAIAYPTSFAVTCQAFALLCGEIPSRSQGAPLAKSSLAS